MSYALFFIHEALAGALFYTYFCRAINMDKATTSRGVMLAFWMLGIASVVMIAAPVVSSWKPTIPSLVLLLAICIVQIVTARQWMAGLPEQFKAAGNPQPMKWQS